MDVEKIGSFIKELRVEKGLSQNQLSEQIHVTRQAISNWENGKAVPDSDILRNLSKMFNVSIDELLSGERLDHSKNKLEDIALSLVDQNNQNQLKMKKMLLAFFMTIFSFIILFLVYYFLSNYNSIKVYTVSGESERFVIREGIIISTQKKNYVRIGEFVPKDNIHNIKKIELYIINNNKREELYEIGSSDYIIFNFSDKDRKQRKIFLKELYVDITTEDDLKETIKIEIQEDFKNSLYFNMKKKEQTYHNEEDYKIVELPEETKEEEHQEEIPVIQEEEPVEETPPVVRFEEESEIDYQKVISKIEANGDTTLGTNTIELMNENEYINISGCNNNIYIDTMFDNIIESIHFNVTSKIIYYSKYENYVEVLYEEYTENTQEYKDLLERINDYLRAANVLE